VGPETRPSVHSVVSAVTDIVGPQDSSLPPASNNYWSILGEFSLLIFLLRMVQSVFCIIAVICV